MTNVSGNNSCNFVRFNVSRSNACNSKFCDPNENYGPDKNNCNDVNFYRDENNNTDSRCIQNRNYCQYTNENMSTKRDTPIKRVANIVQFLQYCLDCKYGLHLSHSKLMFYAERTLPAWYRSIVHCCEQQTEQFLIARRERYFKLYISKLGIPAKFCDDRSHETVDKSSLLVNEHSYSFKQRNARKTSIDVTTSVNDHNITNQDDVEKCDHHEDLCETRTTTCKRVEEGDCSDTAFYDAGIKQSCEVIASSCTKSQRCTSKCAHKVSALARKIVQKATNDLLTSIFTIIDAVRILRSATVMPYFRSIDEFIDSTLSVIRRVITNFSLQDPLYRSRDLNALVSTVTSSSNNSIFEGTSLNMKGNSTGNNLTCTYGRKLLQSLDYTSQSSVFDITDEFPMPQSIGSTCPLQQLSSQLEPVFAGIIILEPLVFDTLAYPNISLASEIDCSQTGETSSKYASNLVNQTSVEQQKRTSNVTVYNTRKRTAMLNKFTNGTPVSMLRLQSASPSDSMSIPVSEAMSKSSNQRQRSTSTSENQLNTQRTACYGYKKLLLNWRQRLSVQKQLSLKSLTAHEIEKFRRRRSFMNLSVFARKRLDYQHRVRSPVLRKSDTIEAVSRYVNCAWYYFNEIDVRQLPAFGTDDFDTDFEKISDYFPPFQTHIKAADNILNVLTTANKHRVKFNIGKKDNMVQCVQCNTSFAKSATAAFKILALLLECKQCKSAFTERTFSDLYDVIPLNMPGLILYKLIFPLVPPFIVGVLPSLMTAIIPESQHIDNSNYGRELPSANVAVTQRIQRRAYATITVFAFLAYKLGCIDTQLSEEAVNQFITDLDIVDNENEENDIATSSNGDKGKYHTNGNLCTFENVHNRNENLFQPHFALKQSKTKVAYQQMSNHETSSNMSSSNVVSNNEATRNVATNNEVLSNVATNDPVSSKKAPSHNVPNQKTQCHSAMHNEPQLDKLYTAEARLFRQSLLNILSETTASDFQAHIKLIGQINCKIWRKAFWINSGGIAEKGDTHHALRRAYAIYLRS